jgi:hypothetical protein
MQFYKTSVELPRWICAVLVGCGVLAYIATVSTDIYYGGLATTVDNVGIAIQSISMVVVSGLTLSLSSFSGFLMRDRAVDYCPCVALHCWLFHEL